MDIEYFKHKLLELKEDTENRLKHMDIYDINKGQRDAIEELSLYDNHPGDIGTETYEQEKNYALVAHEKHILKEINDALERIDKGSYGICRHCGKPIEEERLDALPYASLCIECEKQNEVHLHELDLSGRPVEEDAISPGYGFNDRSVKRDTEFDAEDSWQAVARYSIPDSDPSFGTGDYIGVLDDEETGIVESVEQISNEEYRATFSPGEKKDNEMRNPADIIDDGGE
ncbi:transcriptional regulator, TraR/DksA family [Caldanaerobius fijiensis DSM 17918]|uniref:Transcriptional regulator, TraR/DksA family n=1 Tax=Caldanaerobius fijiensis DSM 17918 TaxID=1121256 RepID=A0A1M4SY50_9THEO|nr:TraR/DksA C4-type zinc finger protein [Caldanaerobius fijiensis]SHE37162.1 transcriptional regulator, TraR/DksA family [Caldanaerobius fijiensis DSM 17918]